MANVYAVKSGNWSDTTVWNTSALPTVNDDVFANNFTVYVDNNYQVLSVRNTAAAGINVNGGFVLNSGVSLSAFVIGGGNGTANACIRFLSADPHFCTVVGNLTANGPTFIIPQCVRNVSTGTITIIGNGLGGVNNNTDASNGYIDNASTGTINIIGNITGGSGTAGALFGIDNNSTGTINITGDVLAGSRSAGVYISTGGNINILGNLLGRSSVLALVNNGATTTNIFISGNVLAGTGRGLTNNANGTVTVYGFISGGTFAGSGSNNRYGITNTGILNVIGNTYGSASNNNDCYGIYNVGTGRLYLTGNSYGGDGSGGDRPYGILHNGSETIVINGNAYGGNRTSSHGIGIGQLNPSTVLSNNPKAIIYGNAFGGTAGLGVYKSSNSSLIIVGNVVGGTGSATYGAFNDATGYMYVQGATVGNAWGLGSTGINSAPGIFGSQIGTTIVQSLCCGARGQWPTAGNVFILPQQNSTMTFETSAFQDVTLFTSFSANITPPPSSVRLGTKYNLNDYTGTCAVPSVSSVLQGVAVDDSIGIAALQPQTVWSVQASAIDTNSLGGRLKESATVQSFGQLLTAFNI